MIKGLCYRVWLSADETVIVTEEYIKNHRKDYADNEYNVDIIEVHDNGDVNVMESGILSDYFNLY